MADDKEGRDIWDTVVPVVSAAIGGAASGKYLRRKARTKKFNREFKEGNANVDRAAKARDDAFASGDRKAFDKANDDYRRTVRDNGSMRAVDRSIARTAKYTVGGAVAGAITGAELRKRNRK